MAEFSGGEEKLVRENEPITFENKTDSNFDVSMGVVFHKSGIYEVSILGNRTTVSKVTARKTGKWIVYYECPKCGEITKNFTEYCPFCNADMRDEAERNE